MLFLPPKKIKFRRWHKGKINSIEHRSKSTTVSYGILGLKALECGRMTTHQLDAIRKIFAKHRSFKKEQFWIRLRLTIPVTAKPREIRMGKGKGSVNYWAAIVRAGMIIAETGSNPNGFSILKKVSYMLPIKSVIVSR